MPKKRDKTMGDLNETIINGIYEKLKKDKRPSLIIGDPKGELYELEQK